MTKPPPASDLERLIRSGLAGARIHATEPAPQQLSCWLWALLAQPRNLTALADPAAAAAKHIIEPLAGYEAVLSADIAVPHGPLVDVGSGNGAPGLPIALVSGRPAVLLDSRATAADFLRRLPDLLGAPQISIHHARAERAGAPGGALRERFALALSRAAAPPRIALELTIPLLALGGVAIIFARPPSEAAAQAELGATIEVLGGSPMPLAPDLALIAAIKMRPSSDRYPRPWPQLKRLHPLPR